MAYNVKYIKGKQLDQIRDEWYMLQEGSDMTLFQSYQWFQMLLEHYIPSDTIYYESIYAVVYYSGSPVMIAPLWIVKKTFRLLNQKGVYLLGRGSFSDYLNFVYKDFDPNAFSFLMSDLSCKYGVKFVTFENFRESTSFYRYIIENYSVSRNSEYPCVGLNLPASVDEYHKMLSKSSRQNLRTANNRLKKDGRNLIFNFDDQKIDRNMCLDLREAKLSVTYTKIPLWIKYKYRILNRIRYQFPNFTPILFYSDSKVMTAYDDEGKLRAFFNYGYDSAGTCIRVMAAGTDLDFARYSPGMLLMYNFVVRAINEGEMREVDFTRGDEKYKFSLGGQLHRNHTIKFKIR